MKLSYRSLLNYDLHETNGHLGRVRDIYFDDRNEEILFFVIDTGSWFIHHDVLISPEAIEGISEFEKIIQIKLSKEQLEQSPNASTQPPASVQYEKLYTQKHTMPIFWDSDWNMAHYPSYSWGNYNDNSIDTEKVKDIHLRSANELLHYQAKLSNNELDDIVDFKIDTNDWKVSSLILDCGPWYSGTSKEFKLNHITKIKWSKQIVQVDAENDVVKV